jgi:predicted metal-binding protein
MQQNSLYICQKCSNFLRQGAGQNLCDSVDNLSQGMTLNPNLKIIRHRCFKACASTSTAFLTAPGKTSFLLGNLNPDDAKDLLYLADKFANTPLISLSDFPASLRKKVLNILPPS